MNDDLLHYPTAIRRPPASRPYWVDSGRQEAAAVAGEYVRLPAEQAVAAIAAYVHVACGGTPELSKGVDGKGYYRFAVGYVASKGVGSRWRERVSRDWTEAQARAAGMINVWGEEVVKASDCFSDDPCGDTTGIGRDWRIPDPSEIGNVLVPLVKRAEAKRRAWAFAATRLNRPQQIAQRELAEAQRHIAAALSREWLPDADAAAMLPATPAAVVSSQETPQPSARGKVGPVATDATNATWGGLLSDYEAEVRADAAIKDGTRDATAKASSTSVARLSRVRWLLPWQRL